MIYYISLKIANNPQMGVVEVSRPNAFFFKFWASSYISLKRQFKFRIETNSCERYMAYPVAVR